MTGLGLRRRLLQRVLVAGLALVGVLIILVGIDSARTAYADVRAKRMAADLRRRVSPGSSREQAETWFASQHIEPAGVGDERGGQVGLGATVRDDTWFQPAEIRIEVHFNYSGIVTHTSLYRFVYSL